MTSTFAGDVYDQHGPMSACATTTTPHVHPPQPGKPPTLPDSLSPRAEGRGEEYPNAGLCQTHLWGSDLAWSPTGDLATSDTDPPDRATPASPPAHGVRRVHLAPGLWRQTSPGFVGQPGAALAIRAAIRGQISKEAAVAQTPAAGHRPDARPSRQSLCQHPLRRRATGATGTHRLHRLTSGTSLQVDPMQLQLQDFTTLVRNYGRQPSRAARKVVLDLTAGSVLRAILEANASVALWLQWISRPDPRRHPGRHVLGPDLDSWVADFGLARLPGQAAVTAVTFARYTPGFAATIPVGAQVKTGDAIRHVHRPGRPHEPRLHRRCNAQPTTSPRPPRPDHRPGPGHPSPGTSGNVGTGTISLLATAMPGIDTVTNPTAAAGGMEAEPDAALRVTASPTSSTAAPAPPRPPSPSPSSRCSRAWPRIGRERRSIRRISAWLFFTVTLDDGSGYPPPTTLAAVAAALDAVRPVGTQFAVQPPTVLPANITLTLSHDARGLSRTRRPTSYRRHRGLRASSLPIGAPLPLSRLAAIAYAAIQPSPTWPTRRSMARVTSSRPHGHHQARHGDGELT